MNAIQRRRKREAANYARKRRLARINAFRQKHFAKAAHYAMAYTARPDDIIHALIGSSLPVSLCVAGELHADVANWKADHGPRVVEINGADDLTRMLARAEHEMNPNERGVIVVARDAALPDGNTFEFAHGGSVTVVSASGKAPERKPNTVWYKELGSVETKTEDRSAIEAGTAAHAELARVYASTETDPSLFYEMWKEAIEGCKGRGYVETVTSNAQEKFASDMANLCFQSPVGVTNYATMRPDPALLDDIHKRVAANLLASNPVFSLAESIRANPIEKVRAKLFGGDARDTTPRRVKREAYKKLAIKSQQIISESP